MRNRLPRLRNTVLAFFMMAAACSCVFADDDSQNSRHLVEKAGGFSYVAPSGWTVRVFPGLKYKIAVGPTADGFAENINVADETFAGSLKKYVEASIDSIKKLFKNPEFKTQEAFKTSSSLNGIRLLVFVDQQGKQLAHTFYFFEHGD